MKHEIVVVGVLLLNVDDISVMHAYTTRCDVKRVIEIRHGNNDACSCNVDVKIRTCLMSYMTALCLR